MIAEAVEPMSSAKRCPVEPPFWRRTVPANRPCICLERQTSDRFRGCRDALSMAAELDDRSMEKSPRAVESCFRHDYFVYC